MATRCSDDYCASYGLDPTARLVGTGRRRDGDDDDDAAAMSMSCGEAGAGASTGLRLFGVQLHAAAGRSSPAAASQHLHRSYSTNSCPSLASLVSPPPPPPSSSLLLSIDEGPVDGYLSDGPHGAATMRERKKGVPWSEEEHRLFLAGLEKLGKGDWRGISRSFVTTRTPTQVASHAQKFFLRQSSTAGKKTTTKRRSSLFDMVQDCDQSGASLVSDPAPRCKNTSASLCLKVSHQATCRKSPDRARPMTSSEASVSEAAQAHGHGYDSHHCCPLDLELGISLSTPSIGT